MSRAAQAHQMPISYGPAIRPSVWAGLLCAFFVLSGCGAGGFILEKAEVDRSLYTSNVPAGDGTPYDAARHSDETTIRNAATSADLETLAGAPLPWANADTGARGQITGLVETKDNGTICRRFDVTREAFDGVRLFRGQACMAGAGAWRMQSFEAASGISS